MVEEHAPAGEPRPLDVPLEDQLKDLPPLQFPGSDNEEFQVWAAQRRQRRLRLEVAGAGLLVLFGIGGYAVTRRPAFVVIAVFAVAALAAYEFLVNSFE